MTIILASKYLNLFQLYYHFRNDIYFEIFNIIVPNKLLKNLFSFSTSQEDLSKTVLVMISQHSAHHQTNSRLDRRSLLMRDKQHHQMRKKYRLSTAVRFLLLPAMSLRGQSLYECKVCRQIYDHLLEYVSFKLGPLYI